MKEGENWQFVGANRYWAIWLDGNGNQTTINVNSYLVDPAFWVALGKSEGWQYKAFLRGKWETEEVNNSMRSDTPFRSPEWQYHWHRFIDHLASGKSTDSFFEELLSK